ncbi:Flagellar motor switch protein FliN [Olavius algarvensis Delta 1 endosymbiont]|nr:Flagellar motor switch protein FliN [Olavius algarvensis Delta 1 endosymbiont]
MAIYDENIGPAGTNDSDSEASNRTFAAGGAAPTSQDAGAGDGSANMEFVLDIPLEVAVELGRTKMLINDLLKLGQGSVIELSKLAGESLDILANQKPIARGEVVVVNEKYGIRLTEVISPMERIERLR